MSNINKVILNDETYNIEDANATNNIRQINDDIDAVNSKIQGLQTTINENNSQLEGKLKNIPYKNRKYALIGDSYALVNPSSENNWARTLTQFLGAENVSLNAVSGAGFTQSGAKSFSTILDSFEDSDSVTDVVVCGGANDLYYNELIPDAVLAFRNKAKTKFPNCNVWVGFIGNVKFKNGLDVGNDRTKYLSALQNYHTGSVTYLNGVEYSNIFQSDMIDQTHPNASAGTRIGSAIFRALTSGGYFLNHSGFDVIISSNGSSTSKAVIKGKIVNNFLSAEITSDTTMNIEPGTTIGLYTNKYRQIGYISYTNDLLPNIGRTIDCYCIINGKVRPCQLKFCVDNDSAYVNFGVSVNMRIMDATDDEARTAISGNNITILATPVYYGDAIMW